jgi:hypothetical protein
MDAAAIQNAQLGFALFDMWQSTVDKAGEARKTEGSPLVAAVAAAFEQYLKTAEIGMAAQIAGVAVYALNPHGTGAQGITAEQMAPFLALNVMA